MDSFRLVLWGFSTQEPHKSFNRVIHLLVKALLWWTYCLKNRRSESVKWLLQSGRGTMICVSLAQTAIETSSLKLSLGRTKRHNWSKGDWVWKAQWLNEVSVHPLVSWVQAMIHEWSLSAWCSLGEGMNLLWRVRGFRSKLMSSIVNL